MTQLRSYTLYIIFFLIEIFIFLSEKKIFYVLSQGTTSSQESFSLFRISITLASIVLHILPVTFPTQCLPKYKNIFSRMFLASREELY